MNRQNFNPPPGSYNGKPQAPPAEQNTPSSQVIRGVPTGQGTPAPVSAYTPVDPQQPLREYVTPRTGTPPAYPGAGAYQSVMSAYPGQAGAATPQYSGYPPYVAQPGYPMPAPGQAGYPGPAYTYPGYSGPIPAQPGYGAPAAPYSGYPAPTYAYPGYSTPAYSYPGYNTPTPAYPGSGAPAYAYAPGYGYYPWPMAAPRPRRDTYLLVVGIIAFACSCLTILGGLLSLGFMLLVSAIPNPQSTSDQLFSGLAVFLALAIVGLVGGGFCTRSEERRVG